MAHTDGVFAFLRKSGVVDDPGLHWSLLDHRRKHRLANPLQQFLIRPRRIGDQMMHRLMHLPHIVRSQSCGHRLDALALNRQQQSLAVRLQWFMTIAVPCGLRQAVDICRKAFFLSAWRVTFGAHADQCRTKRVGFKLFYNTVVLVARGRRADECTGTYGKVSSSLLGVLPSIAMSIYLFPISAIASARSVRPYHKVIVPVSDRTRPWRACTWQIPVVEVPLKEVLLIGILFFQAPAARPTGASVSGHLSFADGMPVPRALLNLVPVPEPGRQAGQPRFTFGDTAGAFRLQNVPAGRYLVRLGGFAGEAPIYYPGVTGESAASVVTVEPDANIENLNFSLPRALSGVRVAGRVTVPPNQNLQTATQRVQILGGIPGAQINTAWQLTGSIAADGTFEVPHVREGSYTITITQTPGLQPRAIVVSDIDLAEIELSALPRLIPVNGMVAPERKRPASSFSVALKAPLSNQRRRRPERTFTLSIAPKVNISLA